MITEYTRGYRDGYKDALRNADPYKFYPYNLLLDVEGTIDDYDITPKRVQICLANHLTDTESQVLILRYRERFTLEEVGHQYGVTKERIRQIEARAIHKLRRYMKNYSIPTEAY